MYRSFQAALSTSKSKFMGPSILLKSLIRLLLSHLNKQFSVKRKVIVESNVH